MAAQRKSVRALLFLSILAFILLFPWGREFSQGVGVVPPAEKPPPRLESVLAQLVRAWRAGQLSAMATTRGINLLPQDRVRVIVEVSPGMRGEVAAAVSSLGGEVELAHGDLLQATVPVPNLLALEAAVGVEYVRLPYRFTPLVVSEGVGVINADGWQDDGYTGAGIKVGILDGGFNGYDALLGTELPSTVYTWWAPSIAGPGSSSHGTACAEIVYDIAPGATFYLANFSTDVEWANAIDWLISQGVDVISCSMGWLNTGPGDGTGPIDAKVTDARTAGILWSQSAGNQAQRHWSGNWSDPDGDGWLNFTSTDDTNTIYAYAGDQITVGLRWDDPWGASGNDYDLYLLDANLNVVASSTNWQDGDDDPTEMLVYNVNVTGYYHIKIQMYSADGTADFDLFTFGHDLEYQVAARSLLEPADSPDAMTVGAVPWDDPDTLEYFSSQGPTTDGRIKPDIVAPDGVSTATYGTRSFYGTSAAAPHGAGAAVLVKERYPAYTPDQIQSYLEATTIDLGAAGKDNQYGAGRLYLEAIGLVFRIERNTGNVYAKGAYYGAGFVSGSADIAEWVPVSEEVEPGDVLEIDPERPGHYRKARGPCSTLVAGVVSTDPGFVLAHKEDTEGKALLAFLGIVPVKVTDEGGPIRSGDLLVASSTPGYAMRWDPESGEPCEFVGKALEPLEGHQGMILVLLMR